MDPVGLKDALDKFNNITLPALDAIATRLEKLLIQDADRIRQELFRDLNAILDRLTIKPMKEIKDVSPNSHYPVVAAWNDSTINSPVSSPGPSKFSS